MTWKTQITTTKITGNVMFRCWTACRAATDTGVMNEWHTHTDRPAGRHLALPLLLNPSGHGHNGDVAAFMAACRLRWSTTLSAAAAAAEATNQAWQVITLKLDSTGYDQHNKSITAAAAAEARVGVAYHRATDCTQSSVSPWVAPDATRVQAQRLHHVRSPSTARLCVCVCVCVQ